MSPLLNRRRLLLASSALALPLALSACGNGAAPLSDQNLAIVAQDVNLIATGLQGALTQLSALKAPGLTPDILNVAQLALSGLQGVAGSIGGVTTVAQAQPLVQKVETYVNAFVGALAVLPLPPPVQTALLAATILLPLIEAAVNMALPPAASPPPATLSAPPMTPAQARATLAATS